MLMNKTQLAHQATLQKEGWVLANESQPGIYVRTAETEAKNPLDWESEPVELIEEIGVSFIEIKNKYKNGDE